MNEFAKVRKAVIPAAGFGTRFLPFTKAVPKEMVPLVDKPVIQVVVEEAAAAGLTDILIIVSAGKEAIQHHFSPDRDLNERLAATGKEAMLGALRKMERLADIHYIYQHELNGLGDAVNRARSFTGGEPFAVLLGDTVLAREDGSMPVTADLVSLYEETGASAVALEEVPVGKLSRYGVIGGREVRPGVYEVKSLIEKPRPEEAPSRLAIASRYLFTADIFSALAVTPRGKGNEIQLTDAMKLMLNTAPLFGRQIGAARYDLGNPLGFLKGSLEFALRRPELKQELAAYLKQLVEKL